MITKRLFVDIFTMTFVCSTVLFEFGCHRSQSPKRDNPIDLDVPLRVRHSLKTATKDGWKAKAWLTGSAIDFGDFAGINVRLTPEKKNFDNFPVVQVRLKITQISGKIMQEASHTPQFEECAKMKKCKEVTRIDGEFSPTATDFPPAEPCWQAVMEEKFGLDKIPKSNSKQARGKYLMSVEVSIEGGPRILLEDMAVAFLLMTP